MRSPRARQSSKRAQAAAAARVLRFLLDDPTIGPEELEWSELRGVAERNNLLLRVAAAFERRDARLSTRFGQAVARARARSERINRLAARIGEACHRHGIPHVFLKLADKAPDVGRDLDLLVSGSSTDVDKILLDHVPALAGPRRLPTRLAGTVAYAIPEYDTVIDLHHGRLGRLGEHARYAQLLLRRRRLARLGAATCFVPSREDQLIVRALSQFARRPSLRLTDIVGTTLDVRNRRLDWNAVFAAAEATGLVPSLSCHLDYVDQVHRQILGTPLLNATIRARLLPRSWGCVEWRKGSYRFPLIRAHWPVYMEQLRTDLRLGDWEAALRICLLPIFALTARWRRVLHPHPGGL